MIDQTAGEERVVGPLDRHWTMQSLETGPRNKTSYDMRDYAATRGTHREVPLGCFWDASGMPLGCLWGGASGVVPLVLEGVGIDKS